MTHQFWPLYLLCQVSAVSLRCPKRCVSFCRGKLRHRGSMTCTRPRYFQSSAWCPHFAEVETGSGKQSNFFTPRILPVSGSNTHVQRSPCGLLSWPGSNTPARSLGTGTWAPRGAGAGLTERTPSIPSPYHLCAVSLWYSHPHSLTLHFFVCKRLVGDTNLSVFWENHK